MPVIDDPVMAVCHRMPLLSPADRPAEPEVSHGVVPFGMRFAVVPTPLTGGKHNKTYQTQTRQEATTYNEDGREVTVQDNVEVEVEVD
ncbi:hypothetical protein LX15_001769 [Streptoalloteichus tenebrarius]|uniref:Uncharacterized protein n=1 Tax=Streptoalloteichus tenebrarius (strain ATCC 17920 / DSM 40477 / JCM 4838 / CBS 697.72 / NBRC 16177 / NCIMB 11028 / NRRL B-12390 / A12253. 1 / ISP 5477) TaxID=1933 RepID=A0ABT1HRH5_STRSD|nr:hypothetical protein [Streptoalloteichus tenebrarius]MCP2258082.1 hypothetical protein [Streptoalloteichus tenebrarius]BFF01754.1 hypothetical protein GCM10020241_34290 [Streptoalloteichus tenebrarius]